MRRIRRVGRMAVIFGAAVFFASLCFCYGAEASPKEAIFQSRIVWRGDGSSALAFAKTDKMKGTTLSADGVAFVSAPGTYEINVPHVAKDFIWRASLSWKFTGQVRMEFSANGGYNFVPVTCGVPLDEMDFSSGNSIVWRATLSAGSELLEVNLNYSDLSGVLGSWGIPEVSGFKYRKPIYINGSKNAELFNFQVPIAIGESSESENGDVRLKGTVLSDFLDARFTLANQETLVPHWLEKVTGESPARVAYFWIKIPQIPKKGLWIYLYYGKIGAKDLSNGQDVFDFFDSFEDEELNAEKWETVLTAEAGSLSLSNSEINLDASQITARDYSFKNGIIEYKAGTSGDAIGVIARGTETEDIGNRIVYSSTQRDAEHSVVVGEETVINNVSPISKNTPYTYRVIASAQDFIFQRYDGDFKDLETEIEYTDNGELSSGYLGLFAGKSGAAAYFDWVRTRKLTAIPPEVNTNLTGTAKEAVPNLADFKGMTLGENGDLVLSENSTNGEYVSPVIYSPFDARVMIPVWEETPADSAAVLVDISADRGNKYKDDCQNGSYYYASFEDFEVGDSLMWRVRVSRTSDTAISPRIKKFSLDFMPGSILVISPNEKEDFFVAGKKSKIIWDPSHYDASYEMTIECSYDGGGSYKMVEKAAPNSGMYIWKPPAKGTQKALIKVSDSLEGDIYDTSDAFFQIFAGETEAEEDTELLEASASEEETAAAEDALDTREVEDISDYTRERKNTKLYDVVVKLDIMGEAEKEGEGTFKEGDIIMAVPAGHKWSRTERT